MVRKEFILTLLDREIDKMSRFYEEKIEILQLELVTLENKNKSLHGENEELQKQVINTPNENHEIKYEPLIQYITRQSSGIPAELIDQLYLSASSADSLLLLEIFLESLNVENLETSLYILDVLNHNYNPLLHDHDKNNEVFESILYKIFVNEILDVDEKHDELIMSGLKLLIQLRNSEKTDMISDYLQTLFFEILDNILYTNNITCIKLFMRMSMEYNLKTELGEAFNHILKVEWDFLDSSISEDNFIFLLWYAYLFNLEKKLLDQASDSKKWFQESSKELSMYFYLYDCLNQTIIPNMVDFQLRKNMLLEGNVLTDLEKKDVIAKLDSTIHPLISKQKLDEIYEGKLFIINQRQVEFVIQEYDLVQTKFEIPLYKSKNSRELVSGYTTKTIWLNRSLMKAFITEDELKKIKSNSYPLMPKTIKYKRSSFDQSVKPVSKSTSFKWPETELREVRAIEQEENNLNENSALRLMGYQITGLTRDKRWEILKKAVPSLGLRKVATIIAYNVKLRKGQKNGLVKYRNAITEWEHDLAKLKHNYYRKEFKWPNT